MAAAVAPVAAAASLAVIFAVAGAVVIFAVVAVAVLTEAFAASAVHPLELRLRQPLLPQLLLVAAATDAQTAVFGAVDADGAAAGASVALLRLMVELEE
mmetsp:Transcript_67766/g.119653  ORF Transcript_67766/g.119653 Transcript_67766/m.119653 type:complete len:99 (+) Transcript_67766:234-530(+)